MSKPIVIKTLSVLVNITTCLIAVAIVLFQQDWFGKGDTYAFIFWTVPLATGIAISGKTILNLYRRTHFSIKFLLILLSAGVLSFIWAYCVGLALGPWVGAFSIPILYLWIIGCMVQLLYLDWRLPRSTDQSKLSKIVLGLLSFPLTLIVVVIIMYMFSLANSYLTRPEKETYLIPNDFEGEFRVIYGEECGINPPYENGRRVLQIPYNRVLIIQPEFEAGIIDHEYYLVDKNGKRQKIIMLDNYDQSVVNTSGVLLGGSGSMGGAMPDGSMSSESPLAIHFTDFTVFNKDTAIMRDDKEQFKFRVSFDSVTNAFVDECRIKQKSRP